MAIICTLLHKNIQVQKFLYNVVRKFDNLNNFEYKLERAWKRVSGDTSAHDIKKKKEFLNKFY